MLDATFLVDLVRGDPGARAFLALAEGGSEAVRVPAPVIAKFWEGVERARHPPRNVERVRAILMGAPPAPLTTEAAMAAARVLADAARAGVPLDPLDALTAGVAIDADEALVTRNARDFEGVHGLRVRSY